MTYTQRVRSFRIAAPILLLAIILPMSVHAGVLTSLLNALEVPKDDFVVPALDTNPQTHPLLKAVPHTNPSVAVGGGDILVEEGALVPAGSLREQDAETTRRAQNGEISVYVVREGDTLSQIAEMFGVTAKTVLWANDISDASLIQPGDDLIILPITGVRHVVKQGDTIGTIAKKYEGDVADILRYNQLASADEISIGDTVVIPGGEMHAPTRSTSRVAKAPVKTSGRAAAASGFTHPVPGSVKTQGIHGYNAVDLAAPVGTPIRAAAAGQVIVAKNSGWNGGYGKYIVVKHPNGTQTLYAHNSRNAVGVGTTVAAGQTIGYVGSTGRSTGAHVHFEVRGARNPF
ncbi:MAG: M23 family metallopeptidase [Candidatus Pacebacteria bacterium]|nr:M23 family metallopeptidase [Candidatus Paceibacterota bacterium]